MVAELIYKIKWNLKLLFWGVEAYNMNELFKWLFKNWLDECSSNPQTSPHWEHRPWPLGVYLTGHSRSALLSYFRFFKTVLGTQKFSAILNLRTSKLASYFTYYHISNQKIFKITIKKNIPFSGFWDSSCSTPSTPELSSIFIFAFFVLLLSSSFSLSAV